MNIDSILKKEGIEIKNKLNEAQVKKIATIVSSQICQAFQEHNLNVNDVLDNLSRLDMFIVKMPDDSAAAKYFSEANAIYLSEKMDLDNLDTLVIHECIHALQEVKNSRGKVQKLGLFNLSSNKGQGINEASVQLMASIATNVKKDQVKYYNMSFSTQSPLYYPIETALISQIIYFTGSYPLFHSTLHSNNIFKNTFIAKAGAKAYNKIESNFDLIIHYEELLSLSFADLANCSNGKKSLKKINKLNKKIETIKSTILNLTISTQDLIMENCFNTEFDFIKDNESLNLFQQRLYDFSQILISTESYDFYNQYYRQMMQKLEEKRELIKTHGVLTYLTDLQTDLLDLERDNFSFRFFYRFFDKLKLLFEETVRDKTRNDI